MEKNDLKEEKLSSLVKIEPYNDPEDEYSQDLDSYLEDDNIDWEKESYISLLNPNDIQPSEWNFLETDPNNPISVEYSKRDPKTVPPILVVKRGSNSYEAIDGIHRVYAFRLNKHMIPAIIISPTLEQGLSTNDTQMVNFMFNKYKDSNIPTPQPLNNLNEKEDRCKRIADRRYDKPSAYKSGAIVRCRKGNIWKDLKEAFNQLLQEDESLHKWFKRQGPKGKEGGWVDCNAPDGKGGYKACGRKEGEKRSKYPACRPTPAGCKRKGKGKTWGKTKEDMIKLKDLITELDSEKIFHIEGNIIIDDKKRNVQDILSDIRALPGITVVRNIELPQDATSRYFRSSLEIKVDPYPYIKQNKFNSKTTLEIIIDNIKTIPGVIGFKQTATPYSSDN
jgi:hypothetical protein